MSSERKPREATCDDRLCVGLEEDDVAVAEERTREDEEAILDPHVALTLDWSNDLPFLSVTLTMLPMMRPSSSTSRSFSTEPGVNWGLDGGDGC